MAAAKKSTVTATKSASQASAKKAAVTKSAPSKAAVAATKKSSAPSQRAVPVTSPTTATPRDAKSPAKAIVKARGAAVVTAPVAAATTSARGSMAAVVTAPVAAATTSARGAKAAAPGRSGAPAVAAAPATKKVASAPAPTVARPTNVNNNEAIIDLFRTLAVYERQAGSSPFISAAYRKVVDVLSKVTKPITRGADVAKLDGCGVATVTKIDEFLTTGKVKRLEELKTQIGPLPPSLVPAPRAVAAPPVVDVKPSEQQKKTKSASRVKAAAHLLAELAKIKPQRDNHAGLTADALKQLLRRNDMITSGNKAELIERVAHGAALGAIPRCGECGGGRLRFNLKRGTYWCPGFYDDDEFTPCDSRLAFDEVTRTPWRS